jgi:hypothetical protein
MSDAARTNTASTVHTRTIAYRALSNPGPADEICQDNARRTGAFNHHHNESGGVLMVGLSLDDTLHAVVLLTHEHGLPLHGVRVRAGRVQVFTEPVDMPWWVRWLTDPTASEEPCDPGFRCTVWTRRRADESGREVAFHVRAQREGVEWSLAEDVPAEVAEPVLAAHGLTVSTQHYPIPGRAARALADAYAAHASAMDEGGAAR